MSRRRLIQAAVLLAIGVLILYGLLRTVHPDEVVAAIRGANPGWIAIGLAGYLAFLVIRGWRWHVILTASAPAATLGDATAVTAIGFALLHDLYRPGPFLSRSPRPILSKCRRREIGPGPGRRTGPPHRPRSGSAGAGTPPAGEPR